MSGKKTIYRRICIPVLILLVLEGLLLYVCLDNGSMEGELQKYASDAFEAKLNNCSGVLQEKMREQWGDIAEMSQMINSEAKAYLEEKSITYDKLGSDAAYANDFLNTTGQYLLDDIRKNRVDGAFLILCPDVEAAHPYKERNYYGMYFRQRGEDPSVYLEFGDERIAKKYAIERSVTWQNMVTYHPAQKSENYFLRPIEEAYSYNKLEMLELGYWSEAFFLKESDKEQIITYTVPLVQVTYTEDGKEERNIYGAVGIELTMDTMLGQLQTNGNTDYTLLCYEKSQADDNHISGTVETPIGRLKSADTLELEVSEEDDSLYFDNEKLPDKVVSVLPVSLYEKISPYVDSCWAVAGVTDASRLLTSEQNVWNEFVIGMLCFCVLNLLFCYLVIKNSVHPMKRFQQVLQQRQEWSPEEFDKGSYLEFDRVVQLISKREHTFFKEKREYDNEVSRYLSALSRVADAVFEYDCEKDIFHVYNLSREADGTVHTDEVSTEHFMRDMELKQFCRKEDVLAFTKLLKGHTQEIIEIKIALRKRMGLVWSAVSGSAILDENGTVAKVVGTIQDIHQKKKLESEAEEANRLDPTTRLLTNKIGEARIREYLFAKDKDVSVSMCIIDLDDFKKVNDYYGLVYGDIILEEVGEILRRYLYDGSMGVRLGGDEFLLFMENVTKEETLRICNSICANIREMYVGYGQIKRITCSIGLVHRNGFVDYNNLLRYAYTAMREVKRQGKDQVEEYFGLYARKGNAMGRDDVDAEREISRIESMSGNNDIVSVTFNIFERSVDFRSTLHVLMKKLGHDFLLSRIVITIFDRQECCSRVREQWEMFGLEPMEAVKFDYGDDEYGQLMENFREQGAVLVKNDSDNILARRLEEVSFGNNNAYEALFCALYDNNSYMGCIMYKKEMDNRSWSTEEVDILKTVTNLIAIHYARYLKEEQKQMGHDSVLDELKDICASMDSCGEKELKERLNNLLLKVDKNEK